MAEMPLRRSHEAGVRRRKDDRVPARRLAPLLAAQVPQVLIAPQLSGRSMTDDQLVENEAEFKEDCDRLFEQTQNFGDDDTPEVTTLDDRIPF